MTIYLFSGDPRTGKTVKALKSSIPYKNLVYVGSKHPGWDHKAFHATVYTPNEARDIVRKFSFKTKERFSNHIFIRIKENDVDVKETWKALIRELSDEFKKTDIDKKSNIFKKILKNWVKFRTMIIIDSPEYDRGELEYIFEDIKRLDANGVYDFIIIETGENLQRNFRLFGVNDIVIRNFNSDSRLW